MLPLVRAELNRLMQQSPAMIEGYIRPGCVHLTLDLLLPRRDAAALTARGLPLHSLLPLSSSCDGGGREDAGGTWQLLAEKGMVVQVGVCHSSGLRLSMAVPPC